MARFARPLCFRPAAVLAPMLALAVAGCSSAAGPAASNPGVGAFGYGGVTGGGYGMMGGSAAGGAEGGEPVSSVTPTTESRLEVAVPAGAAVDRATNTVTFSARTISLPVLAAPADGPDETFRIAGLTNPTIVVPAGARITLELVNADPGMPHDWELSDAPSLAMPMMDAPLFGAITETLSAATSSAMPATTIAFDAASPGRYTYLCTVPGHAEEGMYGTFVVQGG